MVANFVSIETLFVKEKMERGGSGILTLAALKNATFQSEDAFLNFA